MIEEYRLEGLNCANCARKILDSVKKIEEVEEATLNNITNILKVNWQKNLNSKERIERIVHKFEPEVKVILKNEKKLSDKEVHNRLSILMLILGLLFIFGIFLRDIKGIGIFDLGEIFLLTSYFLLGIGILKKAIFNLFKGLVLDENFLMTIATIGALFLGEYLEALAVIILYRVGEFFQEKALKKSKKSLEGVLNLKPDYANLKQGETIVKVLPEEVKINDIIIVKPGEKIPLDGIVIEGNGYLDTRVLTGESLPKAVTVESYVHSGSINTTNVLTLEVKKTYEESAVAKIIELLENAGEKKAVTEKFISRLAKFYTPIVVIMAVLIGLVLPFFLGDFPKWISRSLLFLVISCPCALVISIPLSFFSGIGKCAKEGILIKGGNVLETLCNLDTVIFDKTGTLTEGVFEIVKLESSNNFSNEDLLKYAAIAEYLSNHPIAKSILQKTPLTIKKSSLINYQEHAGLGVSVIYENMKIIAGNKEFLEREKIDFSVCYDTGTKVYVAVNGVFVGVIIINDRVKKDSKMAVLNLKKHVILVAMISGDNADIVNEVASYLEIDCAYGGLLPHEKVEKLNELKGKRALAFIGDGINDAPVLALADVGCAMKTGADIALNSADIVLMTDEPSKFVRSLEIARFTKKIVWQNIIFALGIKLIFLILGAFGYASMWEALFADVGVSLLVIFNSLRIFKLKNKIIFTKNTQIRE